MATSTSHLTYYSVAMITAEGNLISNSGGRDLAVVQAQADERRRLNPDALRIEVISTKGDVISKH